MSEQMHPPESKERGKNVEINFIFARHSEKTSGNVYNPDSQDISDAPLSERGKSMARDFGKTLKNAGLRPKGGYITDIERTGETLREIFKTAEPIDQIKREYLSFPVELTKYTEQRFQEIYEQEREQVMQKQHPGKLFDSLTPAEQEGVSWQATEPALAWFLDLDTMWPDSDKKSEPYQQASHVAYKLRRFIELPEKMENDRRINLLSIGHKTQTEAFLAYVLKGLKGKTLSKRLGSIGGGLHVMESWCLSIKTNDMGNKFISIFFREKEYEVSLDKLNELAQAYSADN